VESRRPARPLQQYGVAIGVTLLAALLSSVLRSSLRANPFALFYAALVISAWYGGLGPGLLSLVLSAFFTVYLFTGLQRFNLIGVILAPRIGILGFLLVAALTVGLIGAMRQERSRAANQERRLRFLATASNLLGSSLDYETTLQHVARLAVPTLADWCVVYLREPSGYYRQVTLAAVRPALEERLRALRQQFPLDVQSRTPLANALRTGRPQIVTHVTDAFFTGLPPSAEHFRALQGLGLKSLITTPLIARGQTLGALIFASAEAEREYTLTDLDFAEEIADRAALAVDNARLYRDAQLAVRRGDEALALLDTLMNSSPAGMAFSDHQFRYVRVNAALAKIIGLPVREILGKSPWQVSPSLWPAVEPLLQEVLTSGKPVVNVEVTGETPGTKGQQCSWLVSYYPVDVHQTETLGIGMVVVDITERRRAEEERERLLDQVDTERTWLKTVIERSPVGIIRLEAFDDQQKVIGNSAVERLFGRVLNPDGGVSQYLDLIRHPDGTPYLYEELPIVRALGGTTILAEEGIVCQPSGREIAVLICAAPIRSAEGRVVGAVEIYEDISALKEVERLREEWTALVAHDLRQPVTVISGYADHLHQLLERGAPPDRQIANVEHIRTASRILGRMVSDLLDMSRIEARRLALQKEDLDLAALTDSVVERLTTVTAPHPVRVEALGNVGIVPVDAARFEQALGNLLSNAAKYGEPQGEILVRLVRQENIVEVAVTNRGVGIPAADLMHIFDRFYRTSQARAENKPGAGLGLYITKGLVEAHGGTIWAESIPQQTTTFHFTLPT